MLTEREGAVLIVNLPRTLVAQPASVPGLFQDRHNTADDPGRLAGRPLTEGSLDGDVGQMTGPAEAKVLARLLVGKPIDRLTEAERAVA